MWAMRNSNEISSSGDSKHEMISDNKKSQYVFPDDILAKILNDK